MTLGVITHLKPDYLECKLKWVLRSITMNKVSGGDGISAELFQILKYDAMKVLHLICQQILENPLHASCEMPDWMKHKLESRLFGEINNLRYADDTTLLEESEKELKSLLMKVKEESEKLA